MNKIYFLALLLMLSFIQIPTTSSAEVQFIGSKVYINDDNVYLSADPHTIGSSGWVVIQLVSKKYTGDIDICFGFNTTECRPTKLEILRNEQWEPLNIPVTPIEYDYQSFNKWYVSTNLPIVQDYNYTIRIYLQIPFAGLNRTQGKYLFAVKPSVETLHEAIQNGHLYVLDPWWDANWNYYTRISFNSTRILSDQNYFPALVYIPPSISGLCDGGNSIRFLSSDNTTELPFEIDYWNEALTSYVWVKVNLSSTTDTIVNMYFNNSLAADGQDVTNVWGPEIMFTTVLHMNYNNLSTGWVNDSSNVVNNASRRTSGAATPFAIEGKIGTSLQFVSANYAYLEFSLVPQMNQMMGNYSLTFIWWMNQNVSDNNDYIFSASKPTASGKLYIQRYRIYINTKTTGQYTALYGGVNDTGLWSQIAFIADFRDDRTRTFSNGTMMVNESTAYSEDIIISTMDSAGYDPNIGTDYSLANQNYYYDGKWDELWIINDTVNPDFINTSFMNQNDVYNFSRILYNETYVAPTGYIVWSINNPTNQSDICLTTINFSFTIASTDATPMNITLYSNYTGTNEFVGRPITNSYNGTYTFVVSNFSVNNTRYYWNATIDNGGTSNNTDYYWFSTNLSLCGVAEGGNNISYAWVVPAAGFIGVLALIFVIGGKQL